MSFLYSDSSFSKHFWVLQKENVRNNDSAFQVSPAFGPHAWIAFCSTKGHPSPPPICYIKKWNKAIYKPTQQDITFLTLGYVGWQPEKTLSHTPSASCRQWFWAPILHAIFVVLLAAEWSTAWIRTQKLHCIHYKSSLKHPVHEYQ